MALNDMNLSNTNQSPWSVWHQRSLPCQHQSQLQIQINHIPYWWRIWYEKPQQISPSFDFINDVKPLSERGCLFFYYFIFFKQKERGSLAQDFQEALHPHWSKGALSSLKVIFLFVYFKQNYKYFCRTQSKCLTKSKVGLSGLGFLFFFIKIIRDEACWPLD